MTIFFFFLDKNKNINYSEVYNIEVIILGINYKVWFTWKSQNMLYSPRYLHYPYCVFNKFKLRMIYKYYVKSNLCYYIGMVKSQKYWIKN
jgi:hypothetical protein